MTTLESLQKGTPAWYAEAYRIMAYDPGQAAEIVRAANRVFAYQKRYESVAQVIGCPWFLVGGIHNMEASCDFSRVLHNGERIIGTGRKTTLVPIGRGPFSSWEAAAIDALNLQGFRLVKDWSLGHLLLHVEAYNGLGYLHYHPKENSPYLWAKTTINDGQGRYVSDGHWSDTADANGQVGFAAIVKELERQGRIKFPEPPTALDV